MACPTCGHTMHTVGVISAGHPMPIYHCQRCGTIKSEVIHGGHHVPDLVHRIIDFAGHLTDEHIEIIEQFERSGVREAITTGDE